MQPLSDRAELAKLVFVAAEVVGHEMSKNAAMAIAAELESYDRAEVVAALRKCQREVTGRLTLAAIIARIDDGHLGPDQAWALCPRSEDATVVWTQEIAQAFHAAEPLLNEGDQVGARMAFREAYVRNVQAARDERRAAAWDVCLGHDPHGRARPVQEAVALGRLPAEHAERYLPTETPRLRLASGSGLGTAADALAALASLKKPKGGK